MNQSRLTDEQLSQIVATCISSTTNIGDLIEGLPLSLKRAFNANTGELEYVEIKQIVRTLHGCGYFHFRDSKNIVADILSVSRTTIYNHLEKLL